MDDSVPVTPDSANDKSKLATEPKPPAEPKPRADQKKRLPPTNAAPSGKPQAKKPRPPAAPSASQQKRRPQPPPTKKRQAVPPPVMKVKVDAQREDGQSNERPVDIARRSARRWLPGMLGSMIFHLALLILLALIFVKLQTNEVVSVSGTAADGDDGDLQDLSIVEETEITIPVEAEGMESLRPDPIPGSLTQQPTSEQQTQSQSNLPITSQLVGIPLDRPSGLPVGGGLQGRKPERRSDLASRRGGTTESETAVELGLAWLAAHQRPNGAWYFNHHDGPCDGRCGQPGTSGCSTAATGLAVLAFLGAGYTPEHGPYKQEVRDGIYYLLSQARINQFGADLQQGSMYGQGIATLALCEAYSMTGDQTIEPIAQKAIDFIVHAQHKAGGWRYVPGAPGDTTVFGWQFMSLKSAQMAGLNVPTPTVHLAKYYLDSVQTAQGAYYGYLSPGKEPSPTSIALLCRMYMGWRRDHEQLGQGIEYLAELGPSKTDLYFDYYATQVMHHHGGQWWEPWNLTMRDHLVESQAKRGHQRGSWYFADEHGDEGGRLYNTAMAIMILEVYYRYMPIYGEESINKRW